MGDKWDTEPLKKKKKTIPPITKQPCTEGLNLYKAMNDIDFIVYFNAASGFRLS